MATLTAPAAARATAKERGLVLPPKPETLVPTEPKGSEKQIRIAQRREQQRIARDHLWPLLSKVFPEVFSLPAVPLAIGIHNQILDAVRAETHRAPRQDAGADRGTGVSIAGEHKDR